MSINPLGSPITLTLGSDDPILLAMDSLEISRRTDDFTRPEFTAELQQRVKEIDGSEANFDFTAKSTKWQIFTGCGPETARPTVPDDDVLHNIFQRFDIVTLEIKGTDSIAAAVSDAAALNKIHAPLYAKLQALRNYVKSDISIDLLLELQGEDYSFLTSTSLTVYAPAAVETFTNCLIKDFKIVPTIQTFDNEEESSSTVFQAWSAVIEAISITDADSTSWSGQ